MPPGKTPAKLKKKWGKTFLIDAIFITDEKKFLENEFVKDFIHLYCV